LFQIFFYFSGLILLLVLNGVPIFQQSVDSELYEWLLRELKRRNARTIQDLIRQVLREAMAEAERHHG
jgi:hypothetical protein